MSDRGRKASDIDGVPEGAPPPVFSKGRDLDQARVTLEPWLARHIGVSQVEVRDFVYPAGAGVSNETLLFTARWVGDGEAVQRDLVLRVAPAPEYQLFLDPEVRMQFDLLELLHTKGHVRVAKPYWFEADPALLGRPFFVMERLYGNVPVSMPVYNSTGFLFDATPRQRRTAWLSAVEQFANIHKVPTSDVGFLDHPTWGATGLEQQLDYWDRCIEWMAGGRQEVPEIMFEIRRWLGDNQPLDHDSGLAWGDARMGNMMFDANFEVAGVMDWEQASLAGAMQDLGWWLFFDDYHSVDHALPRLDGLGSRQETIDLWQELTGRKVHDLHWHEVCSGWKLSSFALRARKAADAADRLKRTVKNQFLNRTCALLGWAPPKED